MKKQLILGLCCLVLSMAPGCGRHRIGNVGPSTKKLVILPEKAYGRGQRPYMINGERYYPIPSAEGFVQDGMASWYGREFHGRPTASGERFDMYKISAAHKTLPLGTYVKAVNLDNQKYVIVRINDRGPFVKGRIIDLSYAAAKRIGLIGPGTARVRITALGREVQEIDSPLGKKPVVEIEELNAGVFTIQVGAFKNKENALRLGDKLKVVYEYVDIEVVDDKYKGIIYRLRVSKSNSLTKAEKIEKELEAMGFDEAFIVSL